MDDAVVVRDAGHKGKGVFAARTFRAGELIMRSHGRVVHCDELAALTAWERGRLAELTGETYRVLEPPRSYLNHSCAPNARQTEDAVQDRPGYTATARSVDVYAAVADGVTTVAGFDEWLACRARPDGPTPSGTARSAES